MTTGQSRQWEVTIRFPLRVFAEFFFLKLLTCQLVVALRLNDLDASKIYALVTSGGIRHWKSYTMFTNRRPIYTVGLDLMDDVKMLIRKQCNEKVLCDGRRKPVNREMVSIVDFIYMTKWPTIYCKNKVKAGRFRHRGAFDKLKNRGAAWSSG
jgi:hypothetical protein